MRVGEGLVLFKLFFCFFRNDKFFFELFQSHQYESNLWYTSFPTQVEQKRSLHEYSKKKEGGNKLLLWSFPRTCDLEGFQIEDQ